MQSRPNILLFICDQLRADHLGCYGNRTIRTPTINSIAARGVAFDRFYVASPVCQPNRATLATGRMPSLHGVRTNGISLALNSNTFIDLLRLSGWRTALIGKSHLQNFGGLPPSLKTPEPREGYAVPPRGHDEAEKEDREDPIYDQENARQFATNAEHDLRMPYYGFEHVELCSNHSTRVHGHYTRWLRERRPDGDTLRGPENALPHDYILPQAWRTRLPEELYPTSYVAERTVAYLDAYAKQGGDAPFFVQCSFPDPHHPFTPPGRYWDMYKADDMALPDAFRLGNRPPPPHVAALHSARDNGTRVADAQPAFACTEREAREAIALTYGMIAMIDDNIAKVLKRLVELGLSKNTVVVFTSDHGDLMGDHQLLLKGNYAYQGLIRVPFIWAEPDGAHAGRRADNLFGTLDIAATMLDRAKIAPYNGIQGRSALAAVNGGGDSGHDGVLIEYGSQRPLHGTTGEMQMRTLVDKRWRITFYRGVSWGEMYDLENDPLELDNLWDDAGAAGAKRELAERLIHKMLELAERSPRPTRSA